MPSPCFGCRRKQTYKWKIEGFSSLLNLGDASHKSGAFEVGGFQWQLCMDITDEKKWLSLFLYLANDASLPTDEVVKASFKLRILDRLYGKHIERKGAGNFQTTLNNMGFQHMICIDKFQDPLSGFLINDSCIFSIDFIELHVHKLDNIGIFECWSLRKERISHVQEWKIEDFTKLQRPYSHSNGFDVGGLKWHLKLYPNGIDENKCVSLFLELHSPIDLSPEVGFYVNFSLSILDQRDQRDQREGKHKKLSAHLVFSSKSPSNGWEKFLSLEDFKDPSKGYLINNSCIITTMIEVLGSINIK